MNETQRKVAAAIRVEWLALREKYGEVLADVELVFNGRLKARLGQCKFRRVRGVSGSLKPVSVEVAKFVLNEPAKAMDTFLHEVAHALAGKEANHGPRWKQWCVTLGAEPSRCGSVAEVHKPAAKYTGTCVECGHEYTRHRKSKKMGVGYTCGVRRGGRRCAGAIEWVVTATGRRIHVESRRERVVKDELSKLFGW